MVYLAVEQEYLVSGSDRTDWGVRYITINANELEDTLEDVLKEPLDSEYVVRGKDGGYDTYTVDLGLRTTVTVFAGIHAEEDVDNHRMSSGY